MQDTDATLKQRNRQGKPYDCTQHAAWRVSRLQQQERPQVEPRGFPKVRRPSWEYRRSWWLEAAEEIRELERERKAER